MTYYGKDFKDENGNFKYYTNPVKAIRAKCLHDCCAGSSTEVENCQCTECFLHPFRFGKNPFRKPMSEERRKISSEVMKKIKEGV